MNPVSFWLLASLVTPLLAPALFSTLKGVRGGVRFLDGFVIVSIPGLILLHVTPEILVEGSVLPLLALVGGVLLPVAAEKIQKGHSDRPDRIALILGLTGFALHVLLEGGALASLTPGAAAGFGLAVVIHRIPVGIGIWWLMESRFGRVWAVAALGSLVLLTGLGFLGGSAMTRILGGELIHLYTAFVGGTLIHVVIHGIHPHEAHDHGHDHDHEHDHGPAGDPGAGPNAEPELPPRAGARVAPCQDCAGERGAGALTRARDAFAEGLGGLLAVAGMVLLVVVGPGVDESAEAVSALVQRFLVLSAESAPALLIAYLGAGLLHAFLPVASIRWMSRGSAAGSAARGMVVGLPIPVCSCGVVPLYRALIQRGAAPAAAMAFLVATPELGLDAILISIPLLGGPMTLVRVGSAALVALLIGWWVGGRLPARKVERRPGDDLAVTPSKVQRMRTVIRSGFGEVVDHTAPWILAGLAIAAVAAPLLEGGWVGRLPAHTDVVLFALLGFPTYVCASSATPLVATLLATGLSPGAAIAFLITGPATNATTFGVVSGAHGRRAGFLFSGSVVGISVVLGIVLNLTLGGLPTPSLEALVEEAPGVIQQVSLVLLAGVFAASLLRRGVRKFAGELASGMGGGHDHGGEPAPAPAGD